jgi:hypothetical protein
VPRVTPAIPEYWEAAVLPSRTPTGRPIPRGPKVATFQEIQAVVIAGQAVCVVFAEASRYYQRPGIVYLPIHDAPAGQWALIWRTTDETEHIRAFNRAAQEVQAQVSPTGPPLGRA